MSGSTSRFPAIRKSSATIDSRESKAPDTLVLRTSRNSFRPLPNGAEESVSRVEKRVQERRRRLLDLTNRNSLLNYRHRDNGRDHIRVIDEIPDLLLERLIDRQGRGLSFRALEHGSQSAELRSSERG